MSCHTWIYKNINTLSQEEFEIIKAKCDSMADRELSDQTTFEELFEKLQRVYGYGNEDRERAKVNFEHHRKKAQHYKENIDKDRSVISAYILTRDFEGGVYVNRGTADDYIRIYDYPEGIYKSAEELIQYCESIDWKSVYWPTMPVYKRAIDSPEDVEIAKSKIIEMFDKNPDSIITFG